MTGDTGRSGGLERLRHVVRRVRGIALARVQLRGARLGRRVAANGRVIADLRGALVLGDRVTLRGGPIPTHLCVHPGATLVIGPECVVSFGASLEARARVELGARCMIASMVRIADVDDDGGPPRPIAVGDDVWIAHGAILGPGVTVGAGAVIAAGSVVVDDVPPAHIASGNPARVAPLALVSREAAPPNAGPVSAGRSRTA
jgi:maltose O-acetyltransferase